MRHVPRSLSEYGFAALMEVEAERPERARYTQLPSYELNKRRPCLDDSPEDRPTKLRRPKMADGVSFCEPIQRDWEW